MYWGTCKYIPVSFVPPSEECKKCSSGREILPAGISLRASCDWWWLLSLPCHELLHLELPCLTSMPAEHESPCGDCCRPAPRYCDPNQLGREVWSCVAGSTPSVCCPPQLESTKTAHASDVPTVVGPDTWCWKLSPTCCCLTQQCCWACLERDGCSFRELRRNCLGKPNSLSRQIQVWLLKKRSNHLKFGLIWNLMQKNPQNNNNKKQGNWWFQTSQ